MQTKTNTGFTLLELMITVGLLAIVVSLAIPSYSQYVVRSNRSEGIEALLTASACQERLLVRNNAYNANACGGATQNGYYTIAFTASNSNQNFVATATPQGNQVNDNCGTLAISDTGVKVAGGQSGAFARACWAGKHASSSS